MNTEERIRKIEERNIRVQAEKAWETSGVRMITIMIMTYIVSSGTLYFIGNDTPFRNAFIPVLGYFLSTQSIPFVKKWWISRHLNNAK